MLLFVLQHSVMASECWKNMLNKLNIVTCQRAIYIISTCFLIQIFMAYLEPVHLEPLWYVSTNKDTLIWLAFFLVHLVAWLLLYATCIIMDFPEMVGIRQVYYQYLDCGPPLIMKSAATRRLYSHMRHGGTSCMMIILWVHPLMTSTRMIVASILTLYLLCGFSVSEHDYIYLREQIARKHITFRLHRTKSIELLQ
ncbi:hypothetical protein LSH36_294g01009 [Paralvinella palmiformis]|uniref:Nuclear envelope membrane protein n=1 Tax=Paralvinella palmiformis TaxID=53620 RepID=A0AAD9JJT5_9ANNE|nr:hypothetical protein LSH36_294g01009 [Paralvinella palmiformis]